ncbi:MAG: histidinol-phosphate transaminase [Deltaproteobacteria bacterium]|nr:histidinol-phosphate transaminase [Deltaproteobacteria bacterium]
MKHRHIERAIILAAGRGSRLVASKGHPKPLEPVAGVPLLVRILRSLQSEGVREAVVVIGYEGAQIRAALEADASLLLRLHFVDNPAWEKSNGVSLLAARAWVDRPCLLSMADHLFAPELVRSLVAADVPRGSCALAVDYDIPRCFDLDDATKVQVERGRIASIGKEIEHYNAIDTGVFLIGPELTDCLAREYSRRGDASLSDGVRALALAGKFQAIDAGDARWIDVDTPEAHARAEAMVRVFGADLGDAPSGSSTIDGESMELFSPSWVRGAPPYREEHFALADASRGARKDQTVVPPRDGAQHGRPNGAQAIARLMSNESPFAPSPRVIEAVVNAMTRGHLYPDATLAESLRARLAARAGLSAASCVLGAGSSELIDLIVRTFVAPGEEAVISVPTFSMYESRTRVCGGLPVLVPTTDELSIDVDAVLAAITERSKIVFLCTPNNPTGSSISETALRRVLRLGLPTVIDEAYIGFAADPHEAEVGFSAIVREFPNAIVLRTFSKDHGLAGLRVGYALANEHVARLLQRTKLPWNVSVVALAAAHAVLDDQDEVLRRRRISRENRTELADAFRSMPALGVIEGDGNFVLLELSEAGISADSLVRAMLTEGVLIRSLTSHHLKRDFVRVSVGSAEDNRRCIAAMVRVLAGVTPRQHRVRH